MTGSDSTAPRPTQPGETRFWCSCDPERRHPYYSSATLVQHVMQARAREAGHGSITLLSARRPR